MKQISESEWKDSWNESGYLKQICQLPYSVQEMEDKFNLLFFEYIEEGLGVCYGAFIEIEKQLFFLIGYSTKTNKNPSVVVWIKSFDKTKPYLVEKICQELNIKQSELLYINP